MWHIPWHIHNSLCLPAAPAQKQHHLLVFLPHQHGVVQRECVGCDGVHDNSVRPTSLLTPHCSVDQADLAAEQTLLSRVVSRPWGVWQKRDPPNLVQ
jgi:hypothetical protein